MIKNRKSTLTFSLIALLCLVLSSPGLAEVKSSYSYFGLGYGNIKYPEIVKESLDLLFETHIGGISYDGGYYWPLPGSAYTKEHTLLGVRAGGVLDAYATTALLGIEEISASVIQNNSLFSVSSIFFAQKIGSGPFIRADLGLSWLWVKSDVTADIAGINVSESVSESSEVGFGCTIGGGISFKRTLLNLDYSYRKIEGSDYNIFSISIGWVY